MAKKNFYAVKQGHNPGIYKTWDECKKQVDGYSGASYKGFATLEEAKEFLGTSTENPNNISKQSSSKPEAIAYVDGSYDNALKEFSYGVVIFYDDTEERFAEKFNTPDLIDMRNVAGEIMGAQKTMQYCIDNDIKSIELYYDYEGIAKWCTGEWKATKAGTKAYKSFYDTIKDKLKINFIKVKGHSGDKYNDLADELAKEALKGEKKVIGMPQAQNVYLERDKLDDLILSVGKLEWADFKAEPIKHIGNQHRCEFTANTKPAMLDFYLRADGSATMRATGINTDLSTRLKELVESQSFKNKHENSTCSFNSINEDIFSKLVDYLKSLEKISVVDEKRIEAPAHYHYKFKSTFGDKMVLNRYDTGKLLLQGNPAYIITEALYFMSISPDISIEDIVARKNEVYHATITISDARAKLKSRISNAYDKLDEIILKLLSSSISLSNSDIEVEEYSCYVFPALKALEALLLDLLFKKGIVVNAKINFGSVFDLDPTSGEQRLTPTPRSKINDSTYEQCVEDIYNYFKKVRHIHFHANQILALTTMIYDKIEADAIFNEILALIDDTGTKIL